MQPKSLADLAALRAEFERCWPWLDAALGWNAFESNGRVWKTHSKEDVWQRIARGWLYLWPASESAVATEFYYTPTGIKSHHTWLAGGNLDEIVAVTPAIERWGGASGCHRQTANGREGWIRMLDGYRKIGTCREKNLT